MPPHRKMIPTRQKPRSPKSLGSNSKSGGGRGRRGTLWLQLFGAIIALYAIIVITWQHGHLNMGLNLDGVTAPSKDNFQQAVGAVGAGGAGGSRWSPASEASEASEGQGQGAIIPFDLSVNHLKLIPHAPGAPPFPPVSSSSSNVRSSEDFLPIVVPSEITFRWRHRAREGALHAHIEVVRGYRLIVRFAELENEGKLLWDSGRVEVLREEGVPISVDWEVSPPMGSILEWQVQIFDGENQFRSSSWSKFAVGPEVPHHWKGGWIVHPSDMDTFDKTTQRGKINVENECDGWFLRRPLPLFRRRLSNSDLMGSSSSSFDKQHIVSALLIVAGLGSFRASFDGVPLSTSGPIDPPFTDYSKRVSYRGFDVTKFIIGNEFSRDRHHVIGITMGSGWWDHRPISGLAKPRLLPRGPQTIMAQLIIHYASGETRIIGETTGRNNKWQVSRGHIRESDLFTGEMIDLDVLETMEGWDSFGGWSEISPRNSTTNDDGSNDPFKEVNRWIQPVPYRTDVTEEARRQSLAIQAKALDESRARKFPDPQQFAAPIGKLIPNEIPPVMPMESIPAEEIHNLGSGRWLLDFGKAMSGMIHFDDGVPNPIVPPDGYPRAHGFKAASANGDSFITVIYGESLEMTTGDINRVLVAGMGIHDGGPRHISRPEGATDGAFCFPDDQDAILSQRDVYIVPKTSRHGAILYSKARQSHFTTHAFRFAEVCCTAEPPTNAHALLYRTAVDEWGSFDSSSIHINGGYELVKNAMKSNMLSVQSDCPHREKLPYGGDLVADSPAALHMFDMSSFYLKTIRDWMDAQWDNGAYTETSIWQDLNDYAGVGHGAGETVWASAPLVLTVRHMQNYGDTKLLKDSIGQHVKWLEFLENYFDKGMKEKGFDEELEEYVGQDRGLGDWLAMLSRDTFLTHTAFYMASGRCIAYIGRQIGDKSVEELGMTVAKKIQDRIVHLYMKKDNFDFPKGNEGHTPGPEMGLFSRIVPGDKRCTVLKNWFRRSGATWPGDEEMRFLRELPEDAKVELAHRGELYNVGDQLQMGWPRWQGLGEGIFAIRYSMKTLSDMGFHNVAVRKASGFGFGTTEYMLSHNATTMWESWWRSEDLYSRNHPMLGAIAEWMPSSAAGLSLYPTTTGGEKVLFWPRFPKSATTLKYASAVQGTQKGEFAIAWKFEDLPSDESLHNSAIVKIRIRLLIPPSGEGVLRLPIPQLTSVTATLRHALAIPRLNSARSMAASECESRRKRRLGFTYSWEYNRENKQWFKFESGKAIGTPCTSFLFQPSIDDTQWSDDSRLAMNMDSNKFLAPGFYEVLISNWQLEKEVEGTGRIGNLPEYYESDDLGPYCKDSNTFEWDIRDATHII